MNEKRSRNGVIRERRRRLLKALTWAGTAATLPEHWKKPVVDSVLLPAHAQTSMDAESVDGCPGSNPAMDIDITFSDDSVQPGQRVTITTTVTNTGDVPLLVSKIGSALPIVNTTHSSDDFPLTLNPGESGSDIYEGDAVDCSSFPYDLLNWTFRYESCAGDDQITEYEPLNCSP